ncbi:hypothetical protein SKAU_G00235330 [Synaphobranchus kaupii]|uniref:Uncharacterized protein n=1 Tax=Synaphobranchus kaupii TaxID=118154 RepID=A0A9Q1F6D9_SYNKA|nr:hypothetical protein SKAU_G00235330 [Synaphobranchus kaupii]
MKFSEWKVQVQAMLRAQALTEDQQTDFFLGALEGTAWREEPGREGENGALLWDQFQLGLEDGPIKQELLQQVRRQNSLTFRQVYIEAHARKWTWSSGRRKGAIKRQPLAVVGHVGGEKTDPQEEEQQREGMLGRCPQVEMEVSGQKFPCLLNTGSQVTLFSEQYYQWWLGDRPMQNPTILECLNLRAANGLQIPFTGYAVSDFVVGGVHVPKKGLVIVWDDCLGSEWGVLGMNVIQHCWGERDPAQIPAHSEVVRWAQVSNGGLAEGQCGLVEDGGEWKVACGLVLVQGGRVLLWIANAHPFPIELPRQRTLATIAGIDLSQVQGGCNRVLQTPSPGEVIIDVQTTEVPAGAGNPLDLPEAEGLTPD